MQFSDSFQLASDFVNYTHSNIFLTGKAGTGKTTFLKHCKENGMKNAAIVAPTGVAAMNAGGATIHSFFQLPFTPYIPSSRGFNGNDTINDKQSLISRLRLTTERREVMQQLELLIIDEISMVRCDVLDAIDIVLRHVRNRHSQSFGGVQVLLIGDMYQLPPVVKDEEWQLLSPYYKSQYFFDSQVMESHPPVYVALDKIYRQNDPSFVTVLNKIRNNEMDQEAFELLERRYMPNFKPSKQEKYIILTTHNNKADSINFSALNEIKLKQENFEAAIEGEFNEKSYPADLDLKIKVGAQVMFIKNDTEKHRRYFNGKIGFVQTIENDKIFISCDGEDFPIEVKKEKWKNIKYSVDKTTNNIEENEIGSFTQFPLRLAWAITIHKSQGLTFEKAIIDAGGAFAPGQVYVALSRCTNLEGMVLHSRILNQSLKSDIRIKKFSSNQKTSVEQMQLLTIAKQQFQTELIIHLFDFMPIKSELSVLLAFVKEHTKSFSNDTLSSVEVNIACFDEQVVTSQKFFPQLNELLSQELIPEKNEQLQLRIIAASNHFRKELIKIKIEIEKNKSETDSKNLATDFYKILSHIYDEVCNKIHLLEGIKNGFSIDAYLEHKRKYIKQFLKVNIYSGKSVSIKSAIQNPELYNLLRKKRDELCDKKDTPVYLIAGSKTLEEMTLYLPKTVEELGMISGFGPIKVRQYGNIFLEIIRDYCDKYDLRSNVNLKEKKARKAKKSGTIKEDTKQVSLNYFLEGKNISEIATERKMTEGTIETHLTYFIEKKIINVQDIITASKIKIIKAGSVKYGSDKIKTIKENLSEMVTYGEIKMVLASLKK